MLEEARPLEQPPFNGRQGFSLVFVGPPTPRWPQGLYAVAHASWTHPLDLFIVPVAADAQGARYQAIFN
jgi:hypothetical protein